MDETCTGMRHENFRLVRQCDVLRAAVWFECPAAGHALAARVHVESSKAVRPECRAEWRGVSRGRTAVSRSISFHETLGMNGGCFWICKTETGIRHENSRRRRHGPDWRKRRAASAKTRSWGH